MEELSPMPQKNPGSLSITRTESLEDSADRNSSDDGSARGLRIRQDITVTVEAADRQGPIGSAIPPPREWEVKGADGAGKRPTSH